VKVSYPHVASDSKEQERVRRDGGQVFMNRVMGSLAVSRALGDHALKRSGVFGVACISHPPRLRPCLALPVGF
jgi:hypothetical protein